MPLDHYRAPAWLPGGHAQTIWAALRAERYVGAPPTWRRERWDTPDGDFIDVERAEHASAPTAPLLVLFHGLEGSSASAYAEAFADFARSAGIAMAVPHFRGCSGELNRAPRAYHSGDVDEIDWVLKRFARESPGRALLAVGISMGGNALLRWAGEREADAARTVSAVAAVCSPLNLSASGHAIGRGFNRQVYTRMFLASMVPKALKKLAQFPGLFDRQALLSARDLYAFDNVFTAPLHGYRDTDDYWARASAQPVLRGVCVPALALNALNDPFVPAESLPQRHGVARAVTLWHTRQGGHVGFPCGHNGEGLGTHVRAMPQAVGQWLLQHV